MERKERNILFLLVILMLYSCPAVFAFELPEAVKGFVEEKSQEINQEPEVQATPNQPETPEAGAENAQPEVLQRPVSKPKAQAPEISIYPDAKPDSSVTKMMKDAMKLELGCYRTNDSIPKVVEFYKKQKGLDLKGAEKEAALFKRCVMEYNEYVKKELPKDCDRDVTIQNPWQDMKTGKMMRDTLICIVNTIQER